MNELINEWKYKWLEACVNKYIKGYLVMIEHPVFLWDIYKVI